MADENEDENEDEDEDEDAVDAKLREWAPELPPLDLTVEGIVQRIQGLSGFLRRSMAETVAEHGLKLGEWGVLQHLRKAGPPYRRSPGELAEYSDLSSGAMTNRLDRMEAAGLLRRLPNPADRRGVLVELTEEGERAWEASVEVQGVKEANLVTSALDPGEREQLNGLLRRLMLVFERELSPKRSR